MGDRMETPTKRRNLTVMMAIILTLILILTGVSLWYVYIRPMTLQEVLEHDAWHAGDVRDLEGTVTEILRVNTSYGPQVLLELDDNWGPGVFGDPNATYRVGDRFRTTMHFTDYSFNGNPGVWAPELFVPVLGLFTSMSVVFDAVSRVAGMRIAYNATDAAGWTSYDILTRNGDAYPLHTLNVSLREGLPVWDWPSEAPGQSLNSAAMWIILGAVEYVALSGGYVNGPEVDRMGTLADGASVNHTIEFVDSDRNGLLNDHDVLRLHLNPTDMEHQYQSYFLEIGGMMTAGGYAGGGKYILEGPRGPYEQFVDGYPVRFRYAGDQVGATVTSTIEVLDTQVPPQTSTSYSFTLQTDGTTIVGEVLDLPITQGGITVDYQDQDSNGLLSAGDRFEFQGLVNRTGCSFSLSSNSVSGDFSWIAGYGEVVGRIPDIRFTAGAGPPYLIRMWVPWWHQDLALNRHATVSLWENSTAVLQNVTLVNGSLGTFPNGSLSFTDADGDGFLSSVDAFTLQGNAGAGYRLEVSVLWGCRTFHADVGP